MLATFKLYWRLYGGSNELLSSRYLLVAFGVTIACYPLWTDTDQRWVGVAFGTLPNLMGFTIASMTVILAIGHPGSLVAIVQKGKEDSFFLKTAAGLFHFLVVQTLAMLIALFGEAFGPLWPLSFVGLLTLSYSILGVLAAAGQLLNLARIVNTAAGKAAN